MNTQTQPKRAPVTFHDYEPACSDMLSDTLTGMSGLQKSLSPKYFYDQAGSALFDQICMLPEYYVTRTELALLERYAAEMGDMAGEHSTLMELGSGSSVKIRTLLNAFSPQTYVAMDISRDHLYNAACILAEDFPWLDVHAVCVDYSQPWQFSHLDDGRRTAFFPGSSLGNFEPHQARTLLSQIGDLVGQGGGLLIGIDLFKDASILEPAYNDSAGVTEAFNKNILVRLNRELGADFEPDNFAHKAIWNEPQSRIEMHLISLKEQRCHIQGHEFVLKESETIHTENSYKYSLAGFQYMAEQAGFTCSKVWTDEDQMFAICYLTYT